MSFLDIKDPAKRTALVDEYIKAMKTVRRRNMVNSEMKLAIGEELQTLFHPIVSATKQAAEKTVGESASVKKSLEDIDGTLKAQQRTIVRPPPSPPDPTFGIHVTGGGRNAMGNSIMHIEGNTLKVDEKEVPTHVSLFQYEANTGWEDGGTCQLSRLGYITSRLGELLTRLFKRMRMRTPDINTGFAVGS